MPQESHDHNFKNVFLDFPRESLELFYPQALEQYGELQEIRESAVLELPF